MPRPEDVATILRDRPGFAWLDGGSAADGWSILAWDPVETVTSADRWPETGRRLTRPGGDPSVPFAGGVLGYVGYEAASAIDRFPAPRSTAEPPLVLSRYEGGLCWRHEDKTWHLAGNAFFRASARAALARADGRAAPPVPPAAPPRRVTTTPRPAYEAAVRRVLDWIAAGDCYQVNLSRPIVLDRSGDPWDDWLRLRRVAGARYGAWLGLGEVAILSSSPELLLEVTGRSLLSVPIKGTRPRHPDPVVDRAERNALRTSEKDRAELTMIVDLVRNDLGRVAAVGSVTWDARRLDPHPNVHHASQAVRATLSGGLDAWDALAALFPPGSVTGAPKIRACERISEVEPNARGVYCGAIGYVSDSGNSCFNVAIRTGVATSGQVRYHVGGGIVADSDPAAEWLETVAKSTAMSRAFAGTPDPFARESGAPADPTASASSRVDG